MKSQMKWLLLTATVIALSAFSAPTFIQPKVRAQDGRTLFGAPPSQGCCDRVSAQGSGALDSSGAFVVDAKFSLSGGQFGGVFGSQTLQIKSTTRLVAQNPPTSAGVINAITSHVWEVEGQSDGDGICEPGEDCMVTLDRAALIPTATPGLMDLRSVLAISDGQGIFAKACGKIDGTTGEGQINFAATPPTVWWKFSGGRLCKCP